MKASSLPPWSIVTLCVLAFVCSRVYLPSAVHPGIVAPPRPERAIFVEGRHSAEGLFSAEDRRSAEYRFGAAHRPQQAADAEGEGHRSLRSREKNAPDIASLGDGIDGFRYGNVTVRPPAWRGQCWIFMHLQKCGGSTVKTMLRSGGYPFSVYDSSQWKRGDDFLASFAAALARGNTSKVVAGGYTEALRKSEPVAAGCRFFTQFRHPIARMVSAYFYCRSYTYDKACASGVVDARDVDLLAFAKHWGNFAVRQFALGFVPPDAVKEYIRTPEAQAPRDFNVQTAPGWYQLKMYLERPQKDDGRASWQSEATTAQQDVSATPDAPLYDLLQPAMDLISHGYVAVGILEQWNTTLNLFDHALEIPGMNWGAQFDEIGRKRVDEGNKQVEADTLKRAWTDSELKKYMRLDLLLYEHAVDVFTQQARRHGIL